MASLSDPGVQALVAGPRPNHAVVSTFNEDGSIHSTVVPAFVLTLLVEELPLRAQGGLAAAQADADTEERLSASRAETAVL